MFCHFTKVAPRNPDIAEVFWLQTKHSLEFTVLHNKENKSVALRFNKEVPNEIRDYLKELGFREYRNAPLKLFAKDRPSYRRFIKDFQQALKNNTQWNNIIIHPSYEPSKDHIPKVRFSKIQFIFKDADRKDQEYIVFEPLQALATKIAKQYSEIHFKDALKHIMVFPRRYREASKKLFEAGQIIYSADSYDKNTKSAKEIIVEPITETPTELPKEVTPVKTKLEPADEAESESKTEKEVNILDKENTEKEPKEKELVAPKKKKLKQWEYQIPFTKKLKYNAKITIAQFKKNSYSYGLNYQKGYGNFSGYAGSPSIYDPQFPSHKKALKAGFTSLIKQIETIIEKGDVILNNDPLHRERMGGVLEQIIALAKEKGFDLPKTIIKNILKEAPTKIEMPLEKEVIPITAPIKEVSRLDREYAQKREANGYRIVQSVIQKLQITIDDIEQDKEITQALINDLLDVSESDDLTKDIKGVIDDFRAQYTASTEEAITFQVLRLIEFFRLSELKANSDLPKVKSITEKTLENMLIPDSVGTDFAYGNISYTNRTFYKREYPYLLHISDDTLESADASSLFELMQFPHPTDYGFAVSRFALLELFENKGEAIFKELDLPRTLNYPYINLHTHHRAVRPLGEIITNDTDRSKWWHAIEHYRPIKDPHFTITLIDEQITIEQEKQEALINPNTGKPKGKLKEEYQNREWTITLLQQSKANIKAYIESLQGSSQAEKQTPKQDPSYLDQVVAIMHTHYHKGERLTKKKIEALLETAEVPTLGMLWEAVELSWLLWYRQLYLQITPFEVSLKAMIRFWNEVQPTYAYSDSSKEKYKQYSTPCLIGAMLAEYTGMRNAEAVFEPSAGNGLLLVGAKPHKTIVNEIDTSRLASLRFQRFSELHAMNASEPFPKKWKHHFDVMVTNPPFARWEEDRFDKNRIVGKYFNKHYELASFMRLEHLMAGLGLDTLKDSGKSGIIIMGHFGYGKDGHINRYAPFYKWLYRHYIVDDVINLNGFTLYNKQGAVASMMLILVGGRKQIPTTIFPTKQTHPQLEAIVESYEALWLRVKSHIDPLKKLVEQLKIANR